MARQRSSGKARKGEKVALLSGGNPQIAKADGDAPVQACIAAMPGWKRDVGKRPSKDKHTRYIDIHEGKLDETQMATWVRQAAALPGWAPGRPT